MRAMIAVASLLAVSLLPVYEAACSKPTIDNGSVSPPDATVEEEESYTASCNTDYTMDGDATMTCTSDGTFSNTPTCTEWTSVTTDIDVYITYDLEGSPLQIKTDSTVGSNDAIRVRLWTSDGEYIGYIYLVFYSTPTYTISSCTYNTNFTADLPAEQDKTWTITKTALALRITCNDVLVVNMQYYNYSSSCATSWSKDVEQIEFYYDRASDWYREKPADNTTCSKPTIENGSVSPSNDTIEAGESYDASCSDGYNLLDERYDIIECYDDGHLSTIPTCTAWTSVTTNVDITYDLEGSPLQIKTDSIVGSNERVRVRLYTSDGEYIGDINWYFYSTPQYKIYDCTSYTNFTADLPADQDKTWTITKTALALRITCNDVLVVNMEYYNYSSSCAATWSMDVEKINFYFDSASDWYREKPAANSTCPKPTIENGNVSPSNDTIEAGEFYNASCSDGYTLDGYDIIECYDDENLSRIPTCAEDRSENDSDYDWDEDCAWNEAQGDYECYYGGAGGITAALTLLITATIYVLI